ncbi:MAG: hypothetical protein JSW10_12440 [Pseudomonadota bacterium]|nr:MAG: hypothetical protein JSW10_12440 [Pseudomonadota bacterium]
MKSQRHSRCGWWLSVLAAGAVCAGDGIGGDFGFRLGDKYEPANALRRDVGEDGNVSYLAKQLIKHGFFDEVYVEVTPLTNRIYRISARGAALNPEVCAAQQQRMRKNLEAAHADAGYYALDDGDMFYNKSRLATLGCTGDERSVTLTLEYLDEHLEAIAEREARTE